MAWTRRRYTYNVDFDDPLMAAETASSVAAMVDHWNHRKGYSEGQVSGTPFGLMQVSIIIFAHDQWATLRRARIFARAITSQARVTLTQVSQPAPEKLPYGDRNRQWREA